MSPGVVASFNKSSSVTPEKAAEDIRHVELNSIAAIKSFFMFVFLPKRRPFPGIRSAACSHRRRTKRKV
jgi:hypothetical protein